MAWFRKEKQKLVAQKRELAADVWEKCDGCGEALYTRRLEENHRVCPECGHHFFVDSKPYRVRIEEAEQKVGRYDAVLTGAGRIEGRDVCAGIMDFGFIGGSMGSVVGEKIARMVERGVERSSPVLIVSASGGARMQEGIFSLMQLAKTSAALQRLAAAGLPYISILTHPTTGGVTASFAMLGDVNLAEPDALIGFAGPRVIKETIRQDLPDGFQRSEFLRDHGMVDRIVPRGEMRDTVALLLHHMS
jgi:acetyl-CoA carboxylase carboxyl transferase subunit beta